jgi:hypothetical protein
VRFNDPTGHMCTDPEDLWSPGCDGANTVGEKPHGGGLGNLGSGNSNSSSGGSSSSSSGGGNSNSGSSGGEIVSLLPDGPACTVNYCGQQNNLKTLTAVDPFTSFSQQYDYSWVNPDPSSQQYYYSYEGSMVPVVGLVVDLAGMVVDGASIMASLSLGPPGVLVSLPAQFTMSTVEFAWSAILHSTGQYESVYNSQSAFLLDSTSARYTDSQEIVPIAGFSASLLSAYNNMRLIQSSFVAHPTTFDFKNCGYPCTP